MNGEAPTIKSKAVLKDPTLTAPLIRKYERAIKKYVDAVGSDAKTILDTTRQLEEIRIDTGQYNDKLAHVIYVRFGRMAAPTAKKYALLSYEAGKNRGVAFMESVGLKADYGMTPVDARVLDVIEGRNLSELTKLSDDVAADIKRAVSVGTINGASIRDMSRAIDEATEIGRVRAARIARTETIYAFNTAAKEQYKKLGIETVEWLAAWDERVCDECGAFHGKQYDMGKEPECPAHPNCRCVLLPVIKEV